jgi:hypothetical protein
MLTFFHCRLYTFLAAGNYKKVTLTSPIINNYLIFVNEKALKM